MHKSLEQGSKRKSNDIYELLDSPAKRTRASLASASDSAHLRRSSRPFREHHWDVQDDNEKEDNHNVQNRQPSRKPQGQGKVKNKVTTSNGKKRGRQSKVQAPPPRGRPRKHPKPQEEQSDDQSSQGDEEPEEQQAAVDARSKRSMTSKEAKAASAMRKSQQKQPQVSKQGDVSALEDDQQSNSDEAPFVPDDEPQKDVDAGEEVEEETNQNEHDEGNNQRFLNQYELLEDLSNVIARRRFLRKPATKAVQAVFRLSNEILDLFEDMQDVRVEIEQEQFDRDVGAKIEHLQDLVKDLDPDQSGDGKVYAHDVYQSAFPGLTRIFIAYCYFFEAQGGLNADALGDLVHYANTIMQLRARATKWRIKPDTKSKIVKPIVNKVIAPLRHICAVFRTEESRLEKIAKDQRKRRKAIEAYRKKQEEEVISEQRTAHASDRMRRLQELYLTRQEVEPDRKRRVHLGLPQAHGFYSGRTSDIDANGSEFERIRLFGSRHGSLSQRSVDPMPAPWSTEQRLDLMEGLEIFGAGDRAFSRIIRKYCGRSGSLRDFKVHQLLEEAVNLRHDLLKAEEKDDTITVPDFMRYLPDVDLLEYLDRMYY